MKYQYESCRKRLATAYHEAGHAVAALAVGHWPSRIEVTDDLTGFVRYVEPSRARRMPVESGQCLRPLLLEILDYWCKAIFISDAGAVVEAQFNFVTDRQVSDGGYLDRINKLHLPDEYSSEWLADYFERHVFPSFNYLEKRCQSFFRQSKPAVRTRIIAEALWRSPCLHGDEIIDLLLINCYHVSRQLDLFWQPLPEHETLRPIPMLPRQMHLGDH